MFRSLLGFIFLMLGACSPVGSDLDNQRDHDLLVLKEGSSENLSSTGNDNNSVITFILGSLSELVHDFGFF